ncbi:MAG: DUF2384 domain-containing protein [Proteobacteria bacterium]|nr:DUF2384 domain-containing protein [Pseudomonadota bacterium]
MQPLQHSSDEDIINEAVVNAARILELKQSELTRIIGPKKTQISNLFNKNLNAVHQSDTVYWDHAILFLRMFRSLYALFGEDSAQSKAWLKNYNYHLLGIPSELIKKTEGLVHVVAYLDAMRGVA